MSMSLNKRVVIVLSSLALLAGMNGLAGCSKSDEDSATSSTAAETP